MIKIRPYILLMSLLAFGACKKDNDSPPTDHNRYVTKLYEYMPAPGQFINRNFGTLADARGLEGKEGLVSLGAWGGYVVYGFDHTVVNRPGKEDIVIYNNAQFNFAEPGVVFVMRDENGNGQPDDTWYEIKGSEFGKPGYLRNYEVTYHKPATGSHVSWSDNLGNTGTIVFPTAIQAFPSWITSAQYTLKGTLLPSTGIDTSNPSLITVAPFAFGYGDNAVGGDRIDIAHAINREGNAVTLSGIDFIKIQTGIQASLGAVGELSTEIVGIVDLNLIE